MKLFSHEQGEQKWKFYRLVCAFLEDRCEKERETDTVNPYRFITQIWNNNILPTSQSGLAN